MNNPSQSVQSSASGRPEEVHSAFSFFSAVKNSFETHRNASVRSKRQRAAVISGYSSFVPSIILCLTVFPFPPIIFDET
jgi:hypothetical protein